MIQKNRLSKGYAINLDQLITFTYNGQLYHGYQGDTLASALLANGIDIVTRSFKYRRPRGIVSADSSEPNAIVQVGSTLDTQSPNIRATEIELFEGLVCHSNCGWPSVRFDAISALNKTGAPLMPPGFYYKTFMSPSRLWPYYEKFIRQCAGIGQSPKLADPDRYEHINAQADITIIGAGPSGFMAAFTAAKSGAKTFLIDDQPEPCANLVNFNQSLNGKPAWHWRDQVLKELKSFDNLTLLTRATAYGLHDDNFITVCQRHEDHINHKKIAGKTCQSIYRLRTKKIILATGALERPLVYCNNDVPGCMLASSVSTYINRYGVIPGESLVLMTTNDQAYQTAFDWQHSGNKVIAIVDTRKNPVGSVTKQAQKMGIKVITGSAVINVSGKKRVKTAIVAPIDSQKHKVIGPCKTYSCDTVASSGGWSPIIHLACHTGYKPKWNTKALGFTIDNNKLDIKTAGCINGPLNLNQCLKEGALAAEKSLFELSIEPPAMDLPRSQNTEKLDEPMALFHVPHTKPTSKAPEQFVDFQNDVTAAGIEIAIREGYDSIELIKRYTSMGFGTDQGKLGNINGMAIAAKALHKDLENSVTTTFRPNYTPITFGAIVGRHCKKLFDPERYTAMQSWHIKKGAKFENVGQWKRPWYYPKLDETRQQTLDRECLSVRNQVGILDASTLGKIDIQGEDAREFLGRIYTNAWAKLTPGRCRYGLMCGEDGMVFDDGVTSCLAENHFLMTTTTGGAAHVLDWLELYHQTEWPEMKVYFNTVTDHWATMTISGPASRDLLSKLCSDIDLNKDAFKFMDWRQGTVAGVPARVFRISFTGELSYEINVQANYGLAVWEQLMEYGIPLGITPYGTETMHILRAEKGFIIAGQDTDGSVTPLDLGMSWCVNNKKPFSYLGKRGMKREDCIHTNRKQLVGLTTKDPNQVIPEGSQAVLHANEPPPMEMLGHISSSYYSACLGHSIALGFIRSGLNRMGETVYYPQADGSVIEATICSPVFLDPKGVRQNV